MNILETERLILREVEADRDAVFICELLNSPKFIKYIGDRGVRTVEQAADFIETRYKQSYRDNRFGLYAVAQIRDPDTPVGVCGFVRRDTLPEPDLGFAFLPEFEGKGFGYESASAVMAHGRNNFGLGRILAITSIDNEASVRLLQKLGFVYDRLAQIGDETVKLFISEPPR